MEEQPRERPAEPDGDGRPTPPPVDPESGTGRDEDPYAREAVIEQLTGPEDADD